MKYYVTVMALSLSLGTTLAQTSEATLCKRWSTAETLTHLPLKDFPEVSGMVASPHIEGRYYFVNDSGDGAYFYSYDLPTGEYEKVEIKGFKGWDIEALSFGPCGPHECLYVGDIGDNRETRKIIRMAGVIEKKHYGKSVQPLFHKILTYPDQATNSEGFVVSRKNHSLYLFSKEFGYFSSDPTKVYKINLDRLLNSSQEALERVGEFTLSGLLLTPLLTVTDAALSPDESRLLLLGYVRSYEIDFQDFLNRSENSHQFVLDFSEVSTGTGMQAEAITYTADGRSILWTFESAKEKPPLLKRSCL